MKKVTRNALSAVVFICTVMIVMPRITDAEDIRLIIRGDDLGMTQGSLVAFERAFNQGVLTCASIIVPGPWFEGAAEICRKNPGWCTGIHLALVGEWRGYRWRPVLPWDKVSSLVDEDGFLFTYPEELLAHNPKLDEMEAELRAQVELAIKKGVNVQYIDTHYGGIDREIVEKIARDYNVPISGRMDDKRFGSIYTTPVEQKTEHAVEMLEELEPGLWLWNCHLGIDSPEHNALIHSKQEDIFPGGGVGKHRAAETDALTSIEVKSIILKKGIKLTNYRELWEEQKKR